MDANDNIQIVQPEVTAIKFRAELDAFRKVENEYRKKGIICLNVKFPTMQFVFTAPTLKPPPILFSVSIDFTNYDVDPPSVKFIETFTGQPVKTKELFAGLFKVIPGNIQALNGQFLPINVQSILVGEPEDYPFVCIPGVREYHDHPQHTGNPWLLSRTKGEGSLAFLLDQLYNHSIPYVKSYNVNVNYIIGINQQVP